MDLQMAQVAHQYGPRQRACRAAVLVAGEGTNPLTQLLQQALPDFGFGHVTLLEQPTHQQLQDSLDNLTALSVEQPWVEAAYVYFTGRGYQWSHDHQQLQLLQVAGDVPHIDPAAAAAAGKSYDPQPPAVLVAPFESLEVAAQEHQVPLLVAVDAAQSNSCRPTQQQLDGFRDALRDRCSFSHRVTAMDSGNEETLLWWGWLMFKHTFIRVHSSWAAAHAAAVTDLAADGYGEVAPCFASDESNTALFPHGPVPEQHHRVLMLLHDIATAAASAPRANRTLHLLQQLALLLSDPDWRPFVLCWGLLTLNAAEGGGADANRSAAAAAAAAGADMAAGTEGFEGLDVLMRQMADMLSPEVRLPGALLVLAAADRPETRVAAAAILRQLQPLTDYGVLPGEVPGKPDAERRQELGMQLLAAQLLAARLAGSGGAGPEGEQQQPLCLVPFVAGFLTCQGLGQELQAATAGRELLAVEDASAAVAGGGGDVASGRRNKRRRADSTSTQQEGQPLAQNFQAAAAAAAASHPSAAPGSSNLPGNSTPPQQQQQQQPPQPQQDEGPAEQEVQLNGVIGLGHAHIPHTVRQLRATDLHNVAPLLQLPQLTKLTLKDSSSLAETLKQLTAVTSLRELCLTYEHHQHAAAAAAAWQHLPVASLFLGGKSKHQFSMRSTMPVMQGLCQLRQLTNLEFQCRMPHLQPADLATTLAPLTSLGRLAMFMFTLNKKNAAEAEAGWQQLLRSIAGLPQLHHLELSCLSWGNASLEGGLAELAACRSSSLTHLNLQISGIADHAAISIVRCPNLKGLRALDLSSNSALCHTSITDATMAAIAANLTALTRLSVGDTQVTEAGKHLVKAALPGIRWG